MLEVPAVAALTILVLALFVGIEIISKVPPLLHSLTSRILPHSPTSDDEFHSPGNRIRYSHESGPSAACLNSARSRTSCPEKKESLQDR